MKTFATRKRTGGNPLRKFIWYSTSSWAPRNDNSQQTQWQELWSILWTSMRCGMGPLPEEQAAAKTTSISSDESIAIWRDDVQYLDRLRWLHLFTWDWYECWGNIKWLCWDKTKLLDYPPGIKAVEMTANIRMQHLYSPLMEIELHRFQKDQIIMLTLLPGFWHSMNYRETNV